MMSFGAQETSILELRMCCPADNALYDFARDSHFQNSKSRYIISQTAKSDPFVAEGFMEERLKRTYQSLRVHSFIIKL